MPIEGKTKVAIVGFCDTSRNWVNYADPELEVWGLNRGYMFMVRADRWFELHGQHIWDWDVRRPGGHRRFLKEFPGPVYMHQRFDTIPNCIEYPLLEVANDLFPFIARTSSSGELKSQTKAPYLTSSIAMEIALAIHEGFEEIQLFGVDLQTDGEFSWQKPAVEFLLGIAAARGIRVVLPDNCPLLVGTIYGRGFMSIAGEQMSYEQLMTRAKALKKQQEGIASSLMRAHGAIDALKEILLLMPPGLDAEKVEQRMRYIQQQVVELNAHLERTLGCIKETTYWMSMTMKGQDPAEAVAQLEARLDADGPETDLDTMQHSDSMFSIFLEAEKQLAKEPELVGA